MKLTVKRKTVPCRYCHGNAKVSTRVMRFYGYSDYKCNTAWLKIGAQVICNACKARGPLFSAEINPAKLPYVRNPEVDEIADKAIDIWNRGGWMP